MAPFGQGVATPMVLSELNVTFCVSLEACEKIVSLGQPCSEIHTCRNCEQLQGG